MLGPKEFTAYKQAMNGELITISGTEEQLLRGALETMLPVEHYEAFQLNIGDSIDPGLLHNLISFTSDEFLMNGADDPLGFTELEPEPTPGAPQNEEYFELAAFDGEVYRKAIVVRGNDTWQVVGLSHGEQVVTILQGVNDRYSGTRDIPGAREVASFGWHSDGPGPISWDGDDCIYEVAGYWLRTSGGDELASQEIDPAPAKAAQSLFFWLDSKNALSHFLLKYLEPKWGSDSLKQRLAVALDNLSEFVSLELNVSEDDIKDLVDLMRNPSSETGPVVEILETDGHPQAEKLVRFIESQDDLYWLNTPLMQQLDEWDDASDSKDAGR
jgi:hypothetical protein